MIELTDDLIFAEGGRRFCFVHPDDPDKCIKTRSLNGDPFKRRKETVWYKKLRPLSMFDDNKRELKSFQELEKKGEKVWKHFPRCYGIQSTNRGDGIVTDLIRSADGSILLTVREYLKKDGKTDELLNALIGFFDFLQESNVITRDILDHNIIVREHCLPQRVTDETTPNTENLKPKTVQPNLLSIYMIDGFGFSEVIPFSQWFRSVTHHRAKGQFPGCFFSREGEATWGRSVQNLCKDGGVV